MASLPPQRPASQRRRSPSPESSSHQEETARPSTFPAQSLDSHTPLVRPASTQAPRPAPAPEAPKEAPQQQDDDEPRRCWICFNDETEDDDTTSEWRGDVPLVADRSSHTERRLPDAEVPA